MTPWVWVRHRLEGLPRSFLWLLGGMTAVSAGTSMVWPFLALFAERQLGIPLAQVGLLITLQSGMRLLGVMLAGPLVDAWGRRAGLILGLAGMAVAYTGLTWAHRVEGFALLLALGGLTAPGFRVAADAMAADLFPPEERDRAFALLRTATNAGIAVGPALGGFFAAALGSGLFLLTGLLLALYAALVGWTVPETRPALPPRAGERTAPWQALRDRRLRAFLAAALPAWMGVSVLWVFLGVYAVEYRGLSESAYGLLVSTNALMVALFQVPVVRWVQGWMPNRVMALGALLYALSVGSGAWATTFIHFWLLIVVMTLGEMLLTPTGSAWVANLAPLPLRGRYMAVFSLMWGLSLGLVSPLGGWVYDRWSPQVLWVLAGALALVSALAFLRLRPPHPSAP